MYPLDSLKSVLGNASTVIQLERFKSWVQEHPTALKIVKIAGVLLGLGCVASFFFATPWNRGVNVGLGIAGGVAIAASWLLSRASSASPLQAQEERREQASMSEWDAARVAEAEPAPRYVGQLWSELNRKSDDQKPTDSPLLITALMFCGVIG